MMTLIGFCTNSLKNSIYSYYTRSMFCSRISHRTEGPPSLLYKLQFSSSNVLVFSCQNELLFNSDKDENSIVPRLPVLVDLK